MKNIGILTLTQSENYGTVLQAKSTLNLFDSICRDLNISLIPSDVRTIRTRRLLSLYNFTNPSFGVTRAYNFIQMRRYLRGTFGSQKRWIDFTNVETAQELLNEQYDGFISGADEIWNLSMLGADSLYIAPPQLGQVRVSFATSANRIRLDSLTSEDRAKLQEKFMSYSLISVRDTNTANLIAEITEGKIVPTEILDPTLLKPPIEPIQNDNHHPRSVRQKSNILLMLKDRDLANIITRDFSGRAQFDAVFVNHRKTRYVRKTPIQFAEMFRNYDLVITDFFHGTCMAILNGANFISIDSEAVYQDYESKISNMLRKLGLKSRYLNACKFDEPTRTKLFDLIGRYLNEPTPLQISDILQSEQKKGMDVAKNIVSLLRDGQNLE